MCPQVTPVGEGAELSPTAVAGAGPAAFRLGLALFAAAGLHDDEPQEAPGRTGGGERHDRVPLGIDVHEEPEDRERQRH